MDSHVFTDRKGALSFKTWHIRCWYTLINRFGINSLRLTTFCLCFKLCLNWIARTFNVRDKISTNFFVGTCLQIVVDCTSQHIVVDDTSTHVVEDVSVPNIVEKSDLIDERIIIMITLLLFNFSLCLLLFDFFRFD